MIRERWRRLKAWSRDSAAYIAESPTRVGIIAVALVAGAAIGAPVGQAGLNYTWVNPNFCDDCHVHDYANEAYWASVHAGVTTCHDCHRVPLSHYPHNLRVTLFATPQTPEDIHNPEVASVLCGACHLQSLAHEELTGPLTEEVREHVVKIDESPLHKAHLTSKVRDPGTYRGGGDLEPIEFHGVGAETEGAIRCMDCHGSGGDFAAHRFTASRENCVACHKGLDHSAGRIEALQCHECHFVDFVGARPE